MSMIAVPKILRDKLSDEGAEALVKMLDKVEGDADKAMEGAQKVTLQIAEERFERKLAETEMRIVRWMFGLWATQMAALIFNLLRK